jgi:hypothetical protein
MMTPMLEGMAHLTDSLTETELQTVGRWLTGTIDVLREATKSLTDNNRARTGGT